MFSTRLYLLCDGPLECEQLLMESGKPSKRRLLERAREDGWVIHVRSHFCAECWKEVSAKLGLKAQPACLVKELP